MREAIEALLRAVDRFFNAHSTADRYDAECLLGAAAAAVRASLAPNPVPDGELLPCPFCGDTSRSDDPPVRGMRWVIQCDKCAARTASYETEALAVTAWNRRAELAREPVELSDAELTIIWDNHYNGDLVETLRAVARAARGESK